MQLAAPEVVDFSDEPRAREGPLRHRREGDRRLRPAAAAGAAAGRERTFASSRSATPAAATARWDAHGDMKTHAPLCRATDKPIAGLIRDLKQRGMLDETLVVWTSEFGRSPWSQNTTGRDHNPKGYTCLAGRRRHQGRHRPRRHRRSRLQGRREPPLLQRPARHDPPPARPRLQEDGVRGRRADHAPGRRRRRPDQRNHRLSGQARLRAASRFRR